MFGETPILVLYVCGKVLAFDFVIFLGGTDGRVVAGRMPAFQVFDTVRFACSGG